MPTQERRMMNGKPVFERPAKSIVNFESGFGPKGLCDDLTFNTSDACPYTCTFCYVPAQMHKLLYQQLAEVGLRHEQVVIRRTEAVERLRAQLVAVKNGAGRKAALFEPRERPLVIYSSTTSDVAANLDLCGETVAACLTILELTPWDIRLLSKSNLLPKIAAAIPPGWKNRVIYGVSTGTADNKLAASFEQGTPLVSARVKSLYWLQDNGHRTFGMICPSLPQRGCDGYDRFAYQMHALIRADRCEEVWAEVINVRGESMNRTVAALNAAGYTFEADALYWVSTHKEQWEEYSRDTFLAHAPLYRPGQLRFLQYVNRANAGFWQPMVSRGAVLLGNLSNQ